MIDRGVIEPEISTQIDHFYSETQEIARERCGCSVRKGQEGNLGTSCRDRFHVRLDETNLGAGVAFEPREDFGHFFPSVRAGSDGDNLGFWVAKNEPSHTVPLN